MWILYLIADPLNINISSVLLKLSPLHTQFEDDMIMKVCSFSENENTIFIIIWIKFTELKDISRDIFKFKSEIYCKTKRTPIEIYCLTVYCDFCKSFRINWMHPWACLRSSRKFHQPLSVWRLESLENLPE